MVFVSLNMKFIKGSDRTQTHLFPVSLDQSIDQDNEVRLIDLFVESLDMGSYGFKSEFKENGRPAYHPSDLLKLYIYGYMNKIRSSRVLEKECGRNIEMMWLLKCLVPDHNTISNFRRDNPGPIKKIFRQTVEIAKHFELIGGKLVGGDSTKMRAQNSKKNNFNPKKIARHIAYIETKLEQYNNELSDSDGDTKKQLKQEIEKYKQRKNQYDQLTQQLEQNGETQVSTSDPESRQMITRNNITEVAYNVQTSVDAKHCLPIDYKVSNTNDSKAMGNMLQRSKTILRSTQFTGLYDKGYHTGSEFKIADDLGIEVMVAIPGVASQAPDPAYNVSNFTYNKKEDYYVCPQDNKHTTPGTWHKAKTYKFKRYTTKACMQCPVKARCSKAKYGKGIQRSEYTPVIEQNKIRIENNKDYYRRRQAIVEHPYGTIKRQWGFDYIITKKYKQRAEADVGFMFIAYNLRRIINILGKDALKKYLRILVLFFSYLIGQLKTVLRPYKALGIFRKYNRSYLVVPANRLKFTA
jgi:transposase